ncbi:hypothetical protein CHLRE_07g341553v5 [Chlamydomonas reinhardtii]|uniref:Reverse transcriptase domain-containing protein n=3 Tax=Chlamydomonas reinhardtii TaxID=3055 RepID=A0A2K3DKN8_CHLRE|nr:uncharacterized protein CHLRE_07g341553v5 [Chlamydomonas reinhardtii]PNW81093.1 hypothetical protein CHLRE_07g341553v5 [Chlamydomonas reinhardtii]
MGASRIDRIMLSPELLSSLRACAHVPGRPSDHRLVVATLAPVDGAVSPGPGLRRLSDAYLAFPDLRRSLLDWNRGACAAAPEAPAPLLRWFVAYKRDLVRTVGRLNRIARGRILEETAEEAAARAAEAAALAVVEAGGPDAAQAAAAAVAARSAAAAAAQRAVARHARAARLQWLRTRETASPAITRLVRPPGGAARIAAIRRPDGSVCDSLPEIPTHIVDYWRRISAAVATDPDACDRVLAALAAFGRRCTDEDAVRLGADTVSSAEVEAALAAAPAGSTPGRDGIPAELYRELGGPTARVLARVFTASLAAGAPPRGFLDGVITCFSKPGDPLQPSSYRPITLLGTDYRTLARVLARRLIPVFSTVIHPAQTAFLPGRRIADNVLLLQLLPELMRVAEGGGPGGGGGGGGGGAAGSTADADRGVVAFLDFYKAYDTLDRNFLYRCLAVMGVGSGFLAWVKLLLTGTRSAALANGYLSAFVLIIAGVRQGCPLAPPLYLAPAQALFAYLDRAGFGVSWADIRLVATAFADDAAPFLRRMANVPGFLAAMETFRAASGQRLNLDKVELLPIGARRRATPAPTRAVAAGLAAGGAAAGNMAAHGVAATSVAAAGGMAAGGAAAGGAVAGGGPGTSHSGGGILAAGGAVPSRAGAVWAAAGVVVTGGVTAGGSAAGAGGAVAAPAPPNTVAMAHGLRVVSHSRTLGVVFYDLPLGTAAAQGAPSLSPAIGTLGTLCGLPLTAFGRGFCASSYAVSRVLYHMEFAGLPPQTVLADFLKTLVRFVDRRIIVATPQGAGRARPPGLPSDCVALPPRDGGFGLLPVVEHVRARHAVLAVRWLQHMHGSAAGTYVPPWTAAATALVQQLHTAAHPLCVLTMQRAAGGVGPAADGCAIFGQPVAATCPALVRLLGALSYLPPVTILRPAVLVPGPWCFALPLWGNPVLPCAAGLQAGGLERDFPALMALPGLLTLGTAVRCWEALAAVRQLVASKPAGALGPRLARRCTIQYKRSVLRPILRITDMARVPPELQSGPDAAAQFSALLARVPAAWRVAASATLHAPGGAASAPPAPQVWLLLAQSLGWRHGAADVPLLTLTVKQATQLQLAPAYDALRVRHLAFIQEAYSGAAPPAEAIHALRAALARLWALVWEPRHKEPLWRLAVNGFTGFGMLAAWAADGRVEKCPCGTQMTAGARVHHFWDCVVAEALRDVMREHANVDITRNQLWLVQAPPGLSQAVWDIVCLAAVAALEYGRQRLYACRDAADRTAEVAVVRRIGVEVIADFWSRLAAFVSSASVCALSAEGGGPGGGGGGGGGGAAGSTADADRGVVAFLDFYKAYDTLDRNFLYRCLAVMGVGSGFLAWVKLLLTGTRSAALANGYLSAFVLIIAGVRQGCPLAPPLYLAPAQALFAYLDRAGFGVSWADIRLVATAFADDAAPFLRRMANVPGFLAAMETFRAASGQRLNLDKVELLPIAAGNMAAHGVAATSVAAAGGMAAGGAAAGVAVAGGGPGASHSGGGSLAAGGAVPSRAGAVWAAAGVVVTGGVTAGGSAAGAGGAVAAPAPPNTVAMAHGLRVVSHSRTLGVVFYDLPLGTAAAQGAPSLSPAIGTLGTLCGLPLTAFGRGFCASSYAVSRVLYHMEFAGLPPQTVLADFLKTLVRFVDRRIIVATPQGAGRARLPGLPSDCVALPPRDGGFGLLPVVEHVRARHAVLAVRWLQHMHGSAAGTYVPPWTAAATALVQQLHTAAHPLCVLTMQRAAGGVGPAADGCAIFGQPVAATCPALVRLLGALSYLPPVTILRPAVLVPGPWCFALPLWGNPVLPCAAGLQAGGLERDFPALMALPGLLTLGTAVRCWEALAAVRQLVASKPAGALGPRLARRCTMQYKRSVLRPILRIADMARVPPELQSGPDAAAQFSALLARMAAACAEPGVAAWRG